MSAIIQLEEVDKKRVKVILDAEICGRNGSNFFVLYKQEAKRLGLIEGKSISKSDYEEIRDEILYKRARKRALYILEKMDKTESQLRNKLRQSYYGEDIIDDAIDYVKKYGYIDDERYARNFVRFQSSKKSRIQMKMDLLNRGIEKEIITEILEQEIEEEKERELIQHWIQKKRYHLATSDKKEKQKIYQFLLRKGFRHDDILYVLDHLT